VETPRRGKNPRKDFADNRTKEAQRKSAGCVSCHSPMDEATMHPTRTVQLGCTDCHGGNSLAAIASGIAANSPEYLAAKQKAHVQPRDPVFRKSRRSAAKCFRKVAERIG